jgi:8-oxo-dGTP pyrophosphatase MutT (NUDIX family)
MTDAAQTPAQDLAARLTKAERDQSFPNLRPKSAGTLIIIDRTGGTPKVLMGRRHEGHKFMPGKFVFPGGRMERGDRLLTFARPLDERVEALLMRRVERPSPSLARGLAMSAIRETFEETGLLVGCKKAPLGPVRQLRDDAVALAGVYPDLSALHFIARAITPPRRPRRFDTRFFAADAQAIGHRADQVVGPDAELVELIWIPLQDAKSLNMPTITQVVLEELQSRIAAGFAHDLPVPFYQMRHRRFVREIL